MCQVAERLAHDQRSCFQRRGTERALGDRGAIADCAHVRLTRAPIRDVQLNPISLQIGVSEPNERERRLHALRPRFDYAQVDFEVAQLSLQTLDQGSIAGRVDPNQHPLPWLGAGHPQRREPGEHGRRPN